MKHLWPEKQGLGASRKRKRERKRGRERRKERKREMSGEAAGKEEGRNCRIRDERECMPIDKYINKALLANEQSPRGNSAVL